VIDHHLGDPLFGQRDFLILRVQPEIAPDRGLQAISVENLSFDCGCLQRFVAYEINEEDVLVLAANMLQGAQKDPGLMQEASFRFCQKGAFERKMRPVAFLPIPGHE
jgi:hypothetical protein